MQNEEQIEQQKRIGKIEVCQMPNGKWGVLSLVSGKFLSRVQGRKAAGIAEFDAEEAARAHAVEHMSKYFKHHKELLAK